jgi:flagellin
MSSTEVTLSSSTRKTLNELQTTAKLLGVASERVSSGLEVESAIDNPTNYFKAESYTDEADSLTSRLDDMEESVEVVNSADNGVESISSYLEQLQGIIEDAQSTTDSDERRELGEQFNELLTQIQDLAQDSGYGGVNLLYGNDSTTVQFSDDTGDSTLTIEGINISGNETDTDCNGEVGSSNVVGYSVVTNADGTTTAVTQAYALTLDDGENVYGIMSAGTSGDSWEIDWGSDDYMDLLDELSSQVESMQSALETESASLSNSLSVITTREDFTEDKITILENGADDLTAADTTEEAANITSLEASQELEVQCLSLASNEADNALSLITS